LSRRRNCIAPSRRTCRNGRSRGIFVSSGWTADKSSSWKAERTWWGKKFSAEEKDVLTHIYDRDFEQMLGLLKQAEFNWIWVTWSSGWSLKDEEREPGEPEKGNRPLP
jgi:hypothetical protein